MERARDAGASAETAAETVWMFNPARGDFDAAAAVRVERDIFRLLDDGVGVGLAAGDLVRCELSEGELIVQKRIVFSPKG